MPFDVVMPDGNVVQDVPDGTTKAQLAAKYQAHLKTIKAQPASPGGVDDWQPVVDDWQPVGPDPKNVVWDSQHKAAPTTQDKILGSVHARFGAGLLDPVMGANALYDKFVGNAGRFVTSGAGYFPNAVSDWFGKAADSGQTINNRETQAIEDARVAMGARPGATDWARVGGNVASPANYLLAPSKGAKLAEILASGAATGATQPVDTRNGQNYAKEVLGNEAVGAGTAGVLGSLAPKARTPEATRRASLVKVLQDNGVQPSIGQQLGGNAAKVEEQVGSIPVLGHFISNAQQARPTDELNRAVYNDVLSSLDQKVPTNLAIGRPSVDHVNQAVSAAYDEVLPKLSLPYRNAAPEIDAVVKDAATLPAERQGQLKAWVSKFKNAATKSGGTIDGETLKGLSSDLRKSAVSLSSDQSSEARDLGQTLYDLHDAVMDTAKSANPDAAAELANVDAAYSKLIRLNKAAGSVGATDGRFTAAQLNRAVLGSVSKRAAAKASGKLPMQELSDAAQAILGPKVPDSGTAGRGLLATALLAAYTNPPLALKGLAAAPLVAGAYSREGQRTLGNALTGDRLAAALARNLPAFASYLDSAAANSAPFISRGATALNPQSLTQ